MANIRIDNFSGDTINIIFNGKTYTVQDEEKLTIEAVEKGLHEITVHRTRVPMESPDFHENENAGLAEKVQKGDNNQHVQLDSIFTVNINASKAVLTVETKVSLKNKFGMDALFSGYSVNVSGAKLEAQRDTFSNSSVRKKFLQHHIKEAMLPVGIIGIILLFVGILAIYGNIINNLIVFGETKLTYPWSIGLTAVALGFCIYTVISLVNIFRTAKIYDEKNSAES